jgi:hypothetical protein
VEQIVPHASISNCSFGRAYENINLNTRDRPGITDMTNYTIRSMAPDSEIFVMEILNELLIRCLFKILLINCSYQKKEKTPEKFQGFSLS